MDGTFTKKPLSQRCHQFPDRTRVRRDLYSAFLARLVCEGCRYARQAAPTQVRNCSSGTRRIRHSDKHDPPEPGPRDLPCCMLGKR
jgi:hypothetical protein